MAADGNLLTLKDFMVAFDTPAYLRRARQVETEWQRVLANCARERHELLEMPRVRLKLLLTGTSAGTPQLEEVVATLDAELLRAQAREWELKWPGASRRFRHASEAVDALQLLRASWERFNQRWRTCIAEIDLTRVNDLRDGYNRYYLIEKECAVRSWQTAQMGYSPLAPATHADLFAAFPLLTLPRSDLAP